MDAAVNIYSYTATTKCSPECGPWVGVVESGGSTPSLLRQRPVCANTSLDLYAAPAIREESGEGWGGVTFLFGRMCLGGQVWLKVM